MIFLKYIFVEVQTLLSVAVVGGASVVYIFTCGIAEHVKDYFVSVSTI